MMGLSLLEFVEARWVNEWMNVMVYISKVERDLNQLIDECCYSLT